MPASLRPLTRTSFGHLSPALTPAVVASAALDFPPASSMDILYSSEQIAERVRQIGAQISADYAAQEAGR